jgi:Protein of unknown function (DUF2796)
MIRQLLIALHIAGFSFAGALAQDETRQLGPHVHGEGRLNLAISGTTILMELEVPAADIVGFEQQPATAGEKAAVDEAKAALLKPLELFVMPAAAGCSVEDASVTHVMEQEPDGAEHRAADETTHSAFQAYYSLACPHSDKIDVIEFRYFEMFANSDYVRVQAITDRGQSAFKLSRGDPVLRLM